MLLNFMLFILFLQLYEYDKSFKTFGVWNPFATVKHKPKKDLIIKFTK